MDEGKKNALRVFWRANVGGNEGGIVGGTLAARGRHVGGNVGGTIFCSKISRKLVQLATFVF